jgi:hypothetical protein
VIREGGWIRKPPPIVATVGGGSREVVAGGLAQWREGGADLAPVYFFVILLFEMSR